MTGDDNPAPVAQLQHGIPARAEVGERALVGLPSGHVPMSTVVHAQHRLGHRDFDPLAFAGALPLIQRGENAGQTFEARVDVGVGLDVVGVHAAGVALDLDVAGFGLDD